MSSTTTPTSTANASGEVSVSKPSPAPDTESDQVKILRVSALCQFSLARFQLFVSFITMMSFTNLTIIHHLVHLQRYYTVLRDFMSYFHQRTIIYPPDHEFTNDELSAITPNDVVNWMNIKLFGTLDPGPTTKPLHGSHHTIGKLQFAIW